ncbi:MAG TPA: efflux transporter outer membrane subunit [Steroidobacteraceae bacterium]|nr:efflux transporter outer membrane subunit [Steroidobacteraceae bacterium]
MIARHASPLRTAAITLFAALLGACATAPRAVAPPPMLDAAGAGLGTSGADHGTTKAAAGTTQATAGTTPATAVPADWWRQFGDPQLDRLVAQALQDNPGLAEAGARLRAAQAQLAGARSATLPAAGLSAGETRARIPSGFPQALAGGQSVWIGDLGASLDWDLDLWGREADGIAQARSQAQAAGLDADTARQWVAGAVVQAYLDLYRSHALADLAQRATEQRQDILDLTRRRTTAGLQTRVELLQAQGAVPAARQTLLQVQADQSLAIHQLALLSGQGAQAYAGITRPQLDPEAGLPVPDTLPLDLLARRPDVLAARARVAASDAHRRAARAAFYPRISLRALAGYASFSLRDLVSAGSFGYGAGGSLALPLFDGGRLRAQYQGADAELEASIAAYNAVVLDAVHEAADQLSRLEALRDEQAQQQQTLDAAEQAYRLASERFRAGLSDQLTVLAAETQVLDARRQQLDLQVALAQARIALLLAVGGSFQPPRDASAPATAIAAH